jgi:class 3 adenylate cyclase
MNVEIGPGGEPPDGELFAWLVTPQGKRVEISGICAIGQSETGIVEPMPRFDQEHLANAEALIHARGSEEFWLLDHGSREGTFLNGRLLVSPTRLQDADKISIRGRNFVFRQKGADPRQEAREESGITKPRFRKQARWLVQVDLAGFTAFTAERDALEVAQLVWPWHAEAKALVEANQGCVNRFVGDGLIATFPDSEEAPTDVVAAVAGLLTLPGPAELDVRVVVHFGDVAFRGSLLDGEEILAAALSFLSRMEKLAGELGHACLISEPARERLGGLLEMKPFDHEQPIRGFGGLHRFFIPAGPEFRRRASLK